jgi:hypothetical protein
MKNPNDVALPTIDHENEANIAHGGLSGLAKPRYAFSRPPQRRRLTER